MAFRLPRGAKLVRFPSTDGLSLEGRLTAGASDRGVVLCLASRNEPGVVDEVLEKHPAMVLRREHFAAMRVNWQPKPDNLRSMAEQLNLGIDSFVFLDDSPVEVEFMRAALPRVLSIALPSEPALLAGVVESLDCFDQWTISEEDRQRGRPVLAGEPPEGPVQLAGRDRGEGALHRLARRLAAHEGFERRRYHWVRSRSRGWSVGGRSAGRK